MNKDFEGWGNLKIHLHSRTDIPTFQQREIWWCSIGVNIGHEEDGKNDLYHRPVLIVRKFNTHIFWGVPLTTQIKNNPYYHVIHFNGKEQCVMLTHMRPLESKRLDRKIGKLQNKEFGQIKQLLKGII
ncbi:MAG: type II toxin-antitoxin system PemK/MazF family toxin [Rickettsiales bacterium]